MAETDFPYFLGTATKYISLVGGITSSLLLESPQNYIFPGVGLIFYLGGEFLQKTSKDKELKNLEDKINGVKK